MKKALLVTWLLLPSLEGYSQHKDTFEVHFQFNVSKLGKEAQAYIDRLIFKDTLIHGDKLMVLGYADFVGGSSYNDTLSLLRATSVRNYLVSSGFDEKNIKLCVGKGKIDRANASAKDGYAPDRKVQIIIDRVAMAQKPPEPPQPERKGKIDINRLKVGETFALYEIYFKLNKPELLPQSEADLGKLLEFMSGNPTVHVQIEGHVCCMGPTEGVDSKYKGRNLSECRAEAIYNYLAEKGISKERMKFVGLGNNNPIVKNELTEADKQKNRRVEIRILSK
ncbi:MAG: OmpA family protein [Flavipsychrobacter sp.]|jgi:outer membrane protein OmpA-like peptidoglycan-associated protein|nr:OmpA family protein [Flavipsychrobacter sp.]